MRKILLLVAVLGISYVVKGSDMQVEVFSPKTADVNAFVFSDSKGTLIVDATRTSKDAFLLAKLARKQGADPEIIFITHGHPDHFLGLGTLRKEFPNAKILVANRQIKNDIINFALAAEKGHWVNDEAKMYPKSEKNPDGFDYENEIQILKGRALILPRGEKLDVITRDVPTESAHETELYSKDLNSLFASDLVYNDVHLWLRGADLKAVKNWKAELKRLRAKYTPRKAKVYPGHGELTDTDIFDKDVHYINDFMEVIRKSKNPEEAKTAMMEKYPEWKNSDFILVQSVKSQFEMKK